VEQGIKSVETANVEVEVYAAEMIEDEVANGVGALDGPLVAVKGVEEPWVMLLDEVTRRLVRPEDVLAARRGGVSAMQPMNAWRKYRLVWHEIPAAL
jgi:hypothetical protein